MRVFYRYNSIHVKLPLRTIKANQAPQAVSKPQDSAVMIEVSIRLIRVITRGVRGAIRAIRAIYVWYSTPLS